MALSKFDLALAIVVAAGLFWIEREHRMIIGTPAAAEAAPAAVCPNTDDVPFSADCIRFIGGGVSPDIYARASAPGPERDARGGAELHAPACPPSNENAPYSADCIKFLSGWYWQANPADSAQ